MAYWKEETDQKSFLIPDEVIDLSFNIECKSLPLDHASALSCALISAAPWLETEQYSAIHLIHGAESGNGWMRPDNAENEILHLSRRARFTLRIHRRNITRAKDLIGRDFDIDGHQLRLRDFKQQLLVPQTTIFARYVAAPPELSEDAFLDSLAPQIQRMGITIKKMIEGRQHAIALGDHTIITRSLMLSDLDKEESIALQQNGLGDKQLFGLGIFLPHKGIAAVKELNDEVPGSPTSF